MFLWIYDLPSWLVAIFIVSMCAVYSWLGDQVFERYTAKAFGRKSINDFIALNLSTVGIFFGLALALISSATWQGYVAATVNVADEASAVMALYNLGDSLPPSNLRSEVRDYTEFVINKAWPLQKKGQIPYEGSQQLADIRSILNKIQPVSPSENNAHSSGVSLLNDVARFRVKRISLINTGLPGLMWVVVVICTGITLSMPWFWVSPPGTGRAVRGMMIFTAAVIGMLVFLMAIMDYPLRGNFSIEPTAFRLILQHMGKSQ